MEDRTVLSRISDLVAEEHRLRDQIRAGAMGSAEERTRLREVEESLDQCWDLLRRRRAARAAGEDPDTQRPRSREQVERYLQ
jgi:hypothetical protein